MLWIARTLMAVLEDVNIHISLQAVIRKLAGQQPAALTACPLKAPP